MVSFLSTITDAFNNNGKLYINKDGGLGISYGNTHYTSKEKEVLYKFFQDNLNTFQKEATEYFKQGKSISEVQKAIDFFMPNHNYEKIDLFGHVYSHWMRNLLEDVKNQPINHILLPSTHNSAAVQVDWSHPIEYDNIGFFSISNASKFLNYLPGINRIIGNWVTNQSESITDQLKHGIRVFDIRVSYNKADGKLYVSHTFTVGDFKEIMKEFENFAAEHPEEVLKINVSVDYMYRYDTYPHLQDVKNILLETFGDKILMPGYKLDNLTLNNLIHMNKNIIITSQGMVPGISYWEERMWHNKQTVEDQLDSVHKFMDNLNQYTPKIEGLAVTPDFYTMVTNKSLYSLATEINSHLNEVLDHYKIAHETTGYYLNAIDLDHPSLDNIESIIQVNLDHDYFSK